MFWLCISHKQKNWNYHNNRARDSLKQLQPVPVSRGVWIPLWVAPLDLSPASWASRGCCSLGDVGAGPAGAPLGLAAQRWRCRSCSLRWAAPGDWRRPAPAVGGRTAQSGTTGCRCASRPGWPHAGRRPTGRRWAGTGPVGRWAARARNGTGRSRRRLPAHFLRLPLGCWALSGKRERGKVSDDDNRNVVINVLFLFRGLDIEKCAQTRSGSQVCIQEGWGIIHLFMRFFFS